jgi:DNA-binding NtrC family response regulator
MSLNIWYVDDEPCLCEIFKEFFTTKDVNVKVFLNPNDALEEAKTVTPDILFIDYRLPSTTGDEIAQMLSPSIPKYLITGEQSVSTVYNFIEIFQKPYKSKVIREVINGYLEKENAKKAA